MAGVELMKNSKRKDALDPLPELDGYVPDGWKDAVMDAGQDRSSEDQQDIAVSESRRGEPAEPWESLKAESEQA